MDVAALFYDTQLHLRQKQPDLKLKTRPKQILGSLWLALALLSIHSLLGFVRRPDIAQEHGEGNPPEAEPSGQNLDSKLHITNYKITSLKITTVLEAQKSYIFAQFLRVP
jgi:hypothetical protein